VSRSLSLTLRTALNAQETGEVPVFLLTVTHDDLATPLRFSSDPTSRISEEPLRYGTVSRSDTYDFLPMTLTLPDDSDGTPPAFSITLDNVMRDMIPLLRSVSTPAQVTIELVLASDPDSVEVTWPDFDLVNASYDAGQISIDLAVNSLATEPYPAGTFTPGAFPALL
jgi:hypothetical protein